MKLLDFRELLIVIYRFGHSTNDNLMTSMTTNDS